MGLTDSGAPAWPRGMPAVIFANWREVLNQTRLSERTRGGYALAIGYLDYCLRNGLRVNKESARTYMSDVDGPLRSGLRSRLRLRPGCLTGLRADASFRRARRDRG